MIQAPSPNFGPRRGGLAPHLVVLHYTAMSSAEAALQRLCDPAFEVSSHYLIGADGRVWHLVDEGMRAWHAGAGSWKGWDDINSRSIGIELDNDGQGPFAEPLMRSLERLLADILARWSIPPQGVIGHSDMAPGRKWDPGPLFDWSRFEAQGLAARPRAAPGPDFRSTAYAAGYTAAAKDADLLAAVRLRLRPQAAGPVAADDMDALTA
ncbi:MAG: N-acetylmuramoyl-L-alanine amidase [Pseudomonadota bacterium]